MSFVEFASILLGSMGTILGILNYLRDRSALTVKTTNNLKLINIPEYDQTAEYTAITITNTGRRGITIEQVFLIYPDTSGEVGLVADYLRKPYKKLNESDPEKYLIDQKHLPPFPLDHFRGCVQDTTGKFWHEKPKNMKCRIRFYSQRLKRYFNGISF